MIAQYHKIDIPARYLDKWQQVIDEMAHKFDVPAGLLMRVWSKHIEVLVASRTKGNPYMPGQRAKLGTGLYCETVMTRRSLLQVPNALAVEQWEDNPDVRLNMIMYMGMPMLWPNGDLFGTICVMDNKIRTFDETYQRLMSDYKQLIESDFRAVQSNHKN